MGNETIQLLNAHHSDRFFLSKPVNEIIMSQIVEPAHRGPTSINAQYISVIIVRDALNRSRMPEIANALSIEAALRFGHDAG